MSVKPNVLCVGFAKCGTTTLYDIMKQHPDIYLSGIKEPIYYGSKDLIENKGFDWYLKRYYPKNVKEKIIMEINPILGRNILAEKIKEDFGKDIKIIFLIRNPASRLYSEFKMNLMDGSCFNTLEENLGDSTSILFDKWISNNFYEKNGQVLPTDDYTVRFCESGNYYSKIKNYIHVFGKENVNIIFFEDFIKDPMSECKKIFEFLNIPFIYDINYCVHSNDGNRLPRNAFGMKASEILFFKIYKEFLIEKLPFISDDFCKLINAFTWEVPKIFSKINKHPEKISEYSKILIERYYYEMINNLSELMSIDLFEKWQINEKGNKEKVLERRLDKND